jgi:ligand-binding SRPBCC domain-containing protein
VQIKGPYSFWHHTHTFREVDGGTEVSDRVVYSMPFGMVGNLLNSIWVRKDLEHIFGYRAKVIGDIFK